MIYNSEIGRKDILDYPFYKSILKIFVKSKGGKLDTMRGFLEFERQDLTEQKVTVFNSKNQEVCTSANFLIFTIEDRDFLLC